ncbi:MAG: YdeI/OmpD-associated family protein [Limisphaerales bacterium]
MAKNHDKEESGVWLVFCKRQTGKRSVEYEEAVEEALCFGWIDSLVKRIDDEQYCRKFTPRKSGSGWSNSNKERAEKIIKEGRMTEFGLAKIKAAKKLGTWEKNPRPEIKMEMPPELSDALARNRRAGEFFEKLAPTYQKHFMAWIASAKRAETKAARLQESMILLARGEKLGLK